MIRLFLFLVMIVPSLCIAQQKDFKPDAAEMLKLFREGRYPEITSRLDSATATKLDAERLKTIWQNLLKNAGDFVSVINVSENQNPAYVIVIQHCQFEKKKIDFKLVFGNNGKVKGIFLLSGEPKARYEVPPYYDEEKFSEKQLYIENGEFRLPALLALPNGKGPFPAVILVHGSGPNDRDETIGPTKIFKDIASGLAARGIAVLRYDKRTRIYAARISREKTFTVKEETIDDAVAAFEMLKNDTLIDPARIYFCGHGLGGMLLPGIAQQTPEVAGLILMAASSEKLHRNFLGQAEYIISLDSAGERTKDMLDSIRTEVSRIDDLAGVNDTVKILRLPVSYWKYLNAYDQAGVANMLKKPMLILHAERDYQVTEKDFKGWKERLKSAGITFRSYPSLNHFFIDGEGRSTPSEYSKPGNVDEEVIADIAGWITGQYK